VEAGAAIRGRFQQILKVCQTKSCNIYQNLPEWCPK
jgi:hypothetical protein